MRFHSTRNQQISLTSKQAIIQGLSQEGGLFVPSSIPVFDYQNHIQDDYITLAKAICSCYLTDFSEEELDYCVKSAYQNRFDTKEIVPLTPIGDTYLLELFHGPTYAFKDLALSLLPHLLTTSYQSENRHDNICILTATSGDTGKAALVGFEDVPHTSICVFYPEDGVSQIQKLQMQTATGSNVKVISVKGNFDDCQRLVKEAYHNQLVLDACQNVVLSSANSINIGRLIPQIVYYFKAYFDLVKNNVITSNEPVNFSVPTGNFGNILAGYLAKKMGLPIHKLICASNSNHVLTDFLRTGTYSRNREFYTTMSPSMDILISSNLERLLYLFIADDTLVSSYMHALNKTGSYTISNTLLQQIQETFTSYYASEQMCQDTIHSCFKEYGKVIDPHTSVAYACMKEYIHETKDTHKCIVLSTASPYKFPSDTLFAMTGKIEKDAFQAMEEIKKLSHTEIPVNIKNLKTLPLRFQESISCSQGMNEISKFIQEVSHD